MFTRLWNYLEDHYADLMFLVLGIILGLFIAPALLAWIFSAFDRPEWTMYIIPIHVVAVGFTLLLRFRINAFLAGLSIVRRDAQPFRTWLTFVCIPTLAVDLIVFTFGTGLVISRFVPHIVAMAIILVLISIVMEDISSWKNYLKWARAIIVFLLASMCWQMVELATSSEAAQMIAEFKREEAENAKEARVIILKKIEEEKRKAIRNLLRSNSSPTEDEVKAAIKNHLQAVHLPMTADLWTEKKNIEKEVEREGLVNVFWLPVKETVVDPAWNWIFKEPDVGASPKTMSGDVRKVTKKEQLLFVYYGGSVRITSEVGFQLRVDNPTQGTNGFTSGQSSTENENPFWFHSAGCESGCYVYLKGEKGCLFSKCPTLQYRFTTCPAQDCI